MKVVSFIYSHFPDSSNQKSKQNDKNGVGNEVDGESNKKISKLSERQIQRLESFIEEQQNKYINGKLNKKPISKEKKIMLDAIDESGITIEKVQGDYKTGIDVIVIRNLTKGILHTLRIAKKKGEQLIPDKHSCSGINQGILLGKLLAKKLQIRNDVKLYESKRKTSGKIDKRLLYSIGLNNTSIFKKTIEDKFGSAIVHISVDASKSMYGDPWVKTMTAVTAIAYAACQVKNLDVVISFRTTVDVKIKELSPLMIIAYDSRKDSFKKIQNLFQYIYPMGITPEGLCFEAIMDEIISSTVGKIGYFINFSDGMPNMSNKHNYVSPVKIVHDMVNKMRNAGIRILSFYIGDYDLPKNFKYMYGKGSRSIPVTKMIPLAKELNKLFSSEKN